MDFVYVCKNGENEELRYSIRSVLNSFPLANIWLVGGKPDWYIGNYIHVDQINSKYKNVINSLIAVTESKDINDTFIFMNDDFFIFKKIDRITNFNGGLLLDKINLYTDYSSGSYYTRQLVTTYNYLLKIGIKNPINYELHVPMIIEKKKLKKVLENKDKFLWRSVYGNIFNVSSNSISDVKIYSSGLMKNLSYQYNEESIYLSTEDNSFKLIEEKLKNKFPNKVLLEKD